MPERRGQGTLRAKNGHLGPSLGGWEGLPQDTGPEERAGATRAEMGELHMHRSHETYNKAGQDRAQCSRGPRASSHCSTTRMDPGLQPWAQATLPPWGLPALCHPPCVLSPLSVPAASASPLESPFTTAHRIAYSGGALLPY